jgi:hypothetical protein
MSRDERQLARKHVKKKAAMRPLDIMRKMSPRLFENLIYDMLIRRGLGNVKWRTPGADGGRDIEGEYVVSDFAGASRAERWYIECKRYRSAVDWPTVHGKLAYANNQGADYLLIATTSSLSATARDQIAIWNRTQRSPAIREWEGVDIERLLSRDLVLSEKYGFSASQKDREVSSIPLLTIVVKLMHEVYGESFKNGEPSPALEFAAAASEYAAYWLDARAQSSGTANPRLDVTRDLFSWCDSSLNYNPKLNPYALRAVLTCLRFYFKQDRVAVRFPTGGRPRMAVKVSGQNSDRIQHVLGILCTMANWEWTVSRSKIEFEARAKQ